MGLKKDTLFLWRNKKACSASMNLSARACEFLIRREKECLFLTPWVMVGSKLFRGDCFARWGLLLLECSSTRELRGSPARQLIWPWLPAFCLPKSPFWLPKQSTAVVVGVMRIMRLHFFLLIAMRTTRFQSMFDSCSSPFVFQKKGNVLTLCLKPHGHSQEILDLFLTCKGLSSFFLTFSFIFWWWSVSWPHR